VNVCTGCRARPFDVTLCRLLNVRNNFFDGEFPSMEFLVRLEYVLSRRTHVAHLVRPLASSLDFVPVGVYVCAARSLQAENNNLQGGFPPLIVSARKLRCAPRGLAAVSSHDACVDRCCVWCRCRSVLNVRGNALGGGLPGYLSDFGSLEYVARHPAVLCCVAGGALSRHGVCGVDRLLDLGGNSFEGAMPKLSGLGLLKCVGLLFCPAVLLLCVCL
jgi:hypothetical protein